ncbi:MAG TPA: hypothetical protein VEP69_02155, partial [Thermodesulfovibrionales bacterium]|nr:hypothetical protein [Thermodesulfovibrionales bacterium]
VHPLVVSGWSETLTVKVSIPVTVMVTSNGAYDGWVLESAQGSGVGGSVGYGRITVGDNAGNRQRKGILFFNTVKIPAGAEIISATLKVTLRHVVGTNPFTTLGTFCADVMKGTFNQKRLQKGDFQVSATAAQAAVMSDPLGNGSISTGSLNGDGINAINKGGITQVRVYFSQPTDGNMTTDAIVFRSGEAYDRANRPALEITYLP